MQTNETEQGTPEQPSRRRFLGYSSTALAAAALAAIPARAQNSTAEIDKAEHDNSGSDPGPENKVLQRAFPQADTPAPTDLGDVGPIWYSFDLVHKRVQEGGWTRQVTQRELPSSNDIAGVNMRLEAGGVRELHWHTADEWAYVLTGKARVTVYQPDGKIFIGDVEEGDLWSCPAGFPHSIQGLDPDGTEFLLVFNQGLFSEDNTVLLSEWMARTPPEVLAKNMGLTAADMRKLPKESLYIFPSSVPPALADDKKEAGGPSQATTAQYTHKLKAQKPPWSSAGGETRQVDSSNFPVSTHLAAVLVTVKPGGMRALHWHPNASEWQYYIAGKGRMTVFSPYAQANTMDFYANDVGYVPVQSGHYIENTGDTDLVFLETFAAAHFEEVLFNNWIRHVPVELASAHLNFDAATIAKIPTALAPIVP